MATFSPSAFAANTALSVLDLRASDVPDTSFLTRGNIVKKEAQLPKRSVFVASLFVAAVTVSGCGAQSGAEGGETTETTETTGTASERLTGCTAQVQPVVLATASSQQAAAFAPKFAIDGVTTSRWSSDKAPEQSLVLDLGKVVNVTGLNINWQTAYSKSYVVQRSDDKLTWGTFIISGATKAGVQSLTGNTSARYLRILSHEATGWGNVSIIDVQVLGTVDSACSNLLSGPWVFSSEDFEPPTFDASTVYSVSGNSIAFTYSGKLFTISGTGLTGIRFKQPVSVVQGGHYRLRLDISNATGASTTLFAASLSGAAPPTDFLPIDAFSNPSGAIDLNVTSAPGANPVLEIVNKPITVFPGAGVQDFTVTATLTKTN